MIQPIGKIPVSAPKPAARSAMSDGHREGRRLAIDDRDRRARSRAAMCALIRPVAIIASSKTMGMSATASTGPDCRTDRRPEPRGSCPQSLPCPRRGLAPRDAAEAASSLIRVRLVAVGEERYRMPISMPAADRRRWRGGRRSWRRCKRIVPDGVIDDAASMAAYESDGADGLSATADGRACCRRRPTQVSAMLSILLGAQCEDRAARRRDIAVGRGAAAGRRRAARHGAVQPHPRGRLRQPLRRRAARRHQSCDHARGGEGRASTTRPIRRARSRAPSAAMSRRIPAAFTA